MDWIVPAAILFLLSSQKKSGGAETYVGPVTSRVIPQSVIGKPAETFASPVIRLSRAGERLSKAAAQPTKGVQLPGRDIVYASATSPYDW